MNSQVSYCINSSIELLHLQLRRLKLGDMGRCGAMAKPHHARSLTEIYRIDMHSMETFVSKEGSPKVLKF